MQYRRDIDGLRAVAVLPVVAFHAGLPLVTGGFVGVDVFFVISGYLIGSNILGDLKQGRFTFASFYERRLRRIFPALLAMLAGVSVLAAAVLTPHELSLYAKSAVAAALSVSNIVFWQEAGYFNPASMTKPLLHTWSLGVEEQFYVFFPILLALTHRLFPRRLRMTVLGIAALSLAVSVYGAFRYPEATYFLPVTRAWELLLGAFIPLGLFPRLGGRRLREASTLAGLGLILIAVLAFTESTPFPGAAALLPCIGAALILAAGESGPTLVSRLLSTRPLVAVGLISYSLYLWHWPIIVLQDVSEVFVHGLGETATAAVVVALSFLAAWISWRFVERPFRTGRGLLTQRGVFAASAIAVVLVTGAGAATLAAGGWPGRFAPSVARVAAYTDQAPSKALRINLCMSNKPDWSDFQPDICLRRVPGRPTYLLVGDSHAAHLWLGISQVLPDSNVLQVTTAGCNPVRGVAFPVPRHCQPQTNLIFDDLLKRDSADMVILAGRWRERDLSSAAETLDWVKAHRIPAVLFGPMPQYEGKLPHLLAMERIRGDATFADRRLDKEAFETDRKLAAIAREKGIRYVSLIQLLCGSGRCLQYVGEDVPLQWDYGHLTAEGSIVVGRRLHESGVLDLE